jgi:hypothetical protein
VCRETAERRFSSARMVRDHVAFYERVLMPAAASAAAGEAA